MKRGRPSFNPKVAICLWVLIEAHREPVQANRPPSSIRQACENLRKELKELCNVDISMERLRAIHRSTTVRLKADAQLRRWVIEMLASIVVWRRRLIAKGFSVYKRQIIPLLLTETS